MFVIVHVERARVVSNQPTPNGGMKSRTESVGIDASGRRWQFSVETDMDVFGAMSTGEPFGFVELSGMDAAR